MSLDSNDDESSHCRGIQLSSSSLLLPHCLTLAHDQVQEDELGERDVCGRQDDSDHWSTPSHDPVVMDSLSRMGSLG